MFREVPENVNGMPKIPITQLKDPRTSEFNSLRDLCENDYVLVIPGNDEHGKWLTTQTRQILRQRKIIKDIIQIVSHMTYAMTHGIGLHCSKMIEGR